MYNLTLAIVIFFAVMSQNVQAQKIEIPGIGEFLGFSEAMSTWEGDHCSIYIEKDGTISTSNSCWSGPKCDYKKGNHTGKVSMKSLKKFAALLGKKDMIVPYVRKKENDEGGGKKVTREFATINTSKGEYILNIMGNEEKVRELIWQMRCEAGIEDEFYLLGNKTYFKKIVYYYPNIDNDFQSYFTLDSEGNCYFSEYTTKSQSAGSVLNFEKEEIKKIIGLLKSEKTLLNNPISFSSDMPVKNKQHYYLVYTNKGIYHINDKATSDEILRLFKLKRK